MASDVEDLSKAAPKPRGPSRLAADSLSALGFCALATYGFGLVSGSWSGLHPVLLLTTYAALVATLLLALARRREGRAIWSVFSLAVLGYAASGAAYALVPDAAEQFPSLLDVGLILFYPLICGSMIKLARRHVSNAGSTVWLDAVIGAGMSATFGAWVLHPLIGPEPSLVVIGQLAYVVGDLFFLGFLATITLIARWRPGGPLTVLFLVAALLTPADVLYLLAASGIDVPVAVSLIGWPAAMLVAARAPWAETQRAVSSSPDNTWQRVAFPVGAAIVGLLIAFVSKPGEVELILAMALLALVLIRLVISLFENAKLYHAAHDQAKRDSLTGLINHGAFHEQLDACLRDEPERQLSVVVFDVDGFKRVNDDYGHAEGDRVLGEVARALRASARSGDHIGRIGGDEFGLLLPDTSEAVAITIAERIQLAIKDLEAGIGISFGVAEWPLHGPSKELLLLRADMALYEAKPQAADRRRLKGVADAAQVHAADPDNAIQRFLAVVCEQLAMPVAYFSEFSDGEQIFRGLNGDANSFGLEQGAGIPLEQSYCQRVVNGELPNVIRNTRADDRVNSLDVTAEAGLGAYVGVPLRFSDGRLYGTLCCASHDPEPALAERDVEFMYVIGRLLVDQLERAEQEEKERLLQAQTISLRGLLAALDARDHYTGEHSEDVVKLARLVARRLCLSDAEVNQVEQVALLHDIGKIGIPDAILHKEGRLSDEEWRVMREHPEIGSRLVEAIEPLAHLAPMVRAEHERWDGGGYPDGLSGEQIPLVSRIVFVCDAYHAMTSDRPYRRAMSSTEARNELRENCGTQFDPDVLRALLSVFERQSACARPVS